MGNANSSRKLGSEKDMATCRSIPVATVPFNQWRKCCCSSQSVICFSATKRTLLFYADNFRHLAVKHTRSGYLKCSTVFVLKNFFTFQLQHGSGVVCL